MFPRKEFQEADGVAVEKAVSVGGDEFDDEFVVVVVVVEGEVIAVALEADVQLIQEIHLYQNRFSGEI